MERVTGVGGIFFKAKDPQALGAWYERHLGICLGWETGALFKWEERGGTVWSRGFGKFGWCMDPEGNHVELWEPPAEP